MVGVKGKEAVKERKSRARAHRSRRRGDGCERGEEEKMVGEREVREGEPSKGGSSELIGRRAARYVRGGPPGVEEVVELRAREKEVCARRLGAKLAPRSAMDAQQRGAAAAISGGKRSRAADRG
eukprot:2545207-Pleurochrysis_carterae.AAC.2